MHSKIPLCLLLTLSLLQCSLSLFSCSEKPSCPKALSSIGLRVPMRDGVALAADLYIPGDKIGQRLPCRLSYSPYGATTARSNDAIDFAIKHGFACLQVDCRGRFNSEGSFSPWYDAFVDDAWDLLDWISQQEWSNGTVTMVGGSYPAATQLSCLRSGHPALKACAPSAVTLDPYSIYYQNGVPVLTFVSSWHLGICTPETSNKNAVGFAAAIKDFPLAAVPGRMGKKGTSWLENIKHERRDEYWAKKSDLRSLAASQSGILFQGSWYDMLGVQTFETFEAFMKVVASSAANSPRKYAYLKVGPWGHGVNTPEGEIKYGADANVTEDDEIDFLTSIAKGTAPKTASRPTNMEIFTMGRNKWRHIEAWPLPNTKYKPLYLNGKALTFEPPTCETGADMFDYDPLNPVPTCGGRIVGAGGQRDQTEIEKRVDVLVYTSEAMKEELEVTGRITASLYVSTSAKDTDFTVKLVDVFPDGTPYNVCDGIMRCRYRDGLDKPARLVKEGEIMKLDFFVDVTSYAFLPGHKIRVEISSSNFPHFARNPNTGANCWEESKPVIAHQTVYRTKARPSAIILPCP